MPPARPGPEVLSVSELNERARAALETHPRLQRLLVQGEVSKWFVAGSGHVYFTLKDERSCVDCVMWRDAATRAPDGIKQGLDVVVQAGVRLYTVKGQYQLQVETVQPAGDGLLWLRFQELRKRLEAHGLFDPARKRNIPRLPKRIGIVTSRDGAAFQDMLHVLARRAPYVEVLLADARVQGVDAAPTLVRALNRMARADVDVVVIARGGGSMEDLWPFNEEAVVRAVAACPHPVLSGVGHETDTTLVDFAADLRCPTPSAAAEKAAMTVDELHQTFDHCETTLARRLRGQLELAQTRLTHVASRPLFRRPEALFAPYAARLGDVGRRMPRAVLVRVERERSSVDDLGRRATRAAEARLRADAGRLRHAAGLLDALSPLKVLARGYAVANKDGHAVRSTREVEPGDVLDVRLADGSIVTRVQETRQNA